MSRRQKPLQITTREHGSLGVYLHEIAQTPVLSIEEERRLVAAIKTGDQRALNSLVAAHLRFVVSVAKQYQGRGLSMDDLVDEGNIGLLRAANNFDASRGQRFIQYAVWSIRQAIEKALRREAETVALTREVAAGPAAEADHPVQTATEHEAIAQRLTLLNEREQQVVKAFFGIDQPQQTLAEIAQTMGLKRERVRQIRKTALQHLRRNK